MKKIILFLTLLICIIPLGASALVDVSPKPLVFTPDTSGKYIYCNNHEFIRREDLTDNSNPNARYVMNNTLGPDKYALFVSHVNHTELRDNSGNITETGFDIELDVLFKAVEDTQIVLTSVGFEVPAHSKYYYEGEEYKFEEAWGCMNAWADYLGMPVKELNSGTTYSNHPFEPVTIDLKAGEKVWLSEFIHNYRSVPFYRPVLILADFQVVSGKTEANVAAVKSTGKVGDRRFVHPNPGFGVYVREKQYKGIADSLNKVDTSLNYTIADWVGGELPVMVYNDFVHWGNPVKHWFTNLNPYSDPWNKPAIAGSDMLTFKYEDDSKLKYYGWRVSEEKRDNVWVFGLNRSDFAEYPGLAITGKSYNEYIPNDYVKADSHSSGMGNFGNYGVRMNYKITITNEGKITRYINYNLATMSNNIVILKDENGNPVNNYAICKGESTTKTTDTMACVEIPGESTKTFIIEVILPTNYVGGMENSLQIANVKTVPKVYENVLRRVPENLGHTGKEYIKWEDWTLHTSPDGENWTKLNLMGDTRKIFEGNWNQYEILYAGDCYMVKPCLYDSAPYYGIREFFTKVYFLDTDFRYKSSYTFYQYPTDISYARGVYYVTAGSKYMSEDLKEWTITDGTYNLPVDNHRSFGVKKSGKNYAYCANNLYLSSVFEGGAPDFAEVFGSIYYYTDATSVYVSGDGMYYDKFPLSGMLDKIDYNGKTLVINNDKYDYQLKDCPFVVSDGKYVVFKNRPFKSDGKIYVPYDFIKDVCNADVSIADDSLVLKDGVVYVGIRDFCEANGFELLYCPSPEGVIITTEGETDEAVTEEFFPKDEDEDSQEEEDASEDKDLKEENSEDEICEDKDLKDEDFDNSL